MSLDLTELLKRQNYQPQKDRITLSSGNSPAISRFIENLPIRTLNLIRSLHLELSLERSLPRSSQEYLLDHIDTKIAFVTECSFKAIRFDRNVEMGFKEQSKMQGLWQ